MNTDKGNAEYMSMQTNKQTNKQTWNKTNIVKTHQNGVCK